MNSTKGKAYYHLERAEYWQSRAAEFEAEAEEKAVEQIQGRMSRKDGMESSIGYVADSLLKENHGYKAACGNRNSHQRQAEIYLLAHMAGIEATPWNRTARGLVDLRPVQ